MMRRGMVGKYCCKLYHYRFSVFCFFLLETNDMRWRRKNALMD